MAKKKESKQKKINVRVDFTPMVDMLMLLITFFMLCTTLSKPSSMQISMPADEQNQNEKDQKEAKQSATVTLYLAADNKIYHGEGIPKYSDPNWIKETTWGDTGLRDVLRNHITEDRVKPVVVMELAVKELLAEQKANPKKITDAVFKQRMSDIKSGNLKNKKITPLTIIIKPTDNATYRNVIDALDEMQILNIGIYVIDKINDQDRELLALKKIKL